MKKFLTLFTLLFVITQQTFAVTASPYPFDFQQPNGDEITVMLKGDERIHWHESLDGYTLLLNQDGYLTYAVLDETGNLHPSDVVATDVEKRDGTVNSFLSTIDKNLFYSEIQKQIMLEIWEIEDEFEGRGERGITGLYKTLCAFVQFPEKAMTIPMSTFDPLFNQLGYTGNGTGSVRDFFKESSYGKFEVEITLCGVYTAPKSESYYAGNGGTTNGSELAKWAAQQVAAESSINFANYDNNNNGKVDGFHVIFAGRGQEAGGDNGTIWSHKSTFWPSVTKNGKSISTYSCSPELFYSNITTIGVICHEMTHAVLSAPDFYDTNNGPYLGTGYWDLMASGSWNGSPAGNRPAHHNMFTKVQAGWITPTVLNSQTTITNMPNSAENPVAYRINTATNNEYYLLENRQKVGFDASNPGAGLLIYHVHSNVNGGICTNCSHPQKMYLVCASSTVAIPTSGASNYGNINSAGCPFPGTDNNTSFTGTSTPRMFRWSNTVITDKPITEISNNTATKTVSFQFMKSGTTQCTISLNASPTNAGTVTGAGTYGWGTSVTVSATPKEGFGFYNWTKDGNAVSTNPNYTFNITETTTLVANFRSNNANLESLTLDNGILTPDFSPDITDYTVNVSRAVSTISITGVAQDENATVTGNVTDKTLNTGENKITITVKAHDNSTKKYIVTVVRVEQYVISASVEDNIGGAISPEGEIMADEGEEVTFEMIPDNGYIIDYVLVDGENVGTDAVYTFSDITDYHNIVVKFIEGTAIKNIDNQRIKIYPNPTDGKIHIGYEICDNGICDIEIYDIMGRRVAATVRAHPCGRPNETETTINVEFLPVGVYFIRITTDNNVIIKKIVKQ